MSAIRGVASFFGLVFAGLIMTVFLALFSYLFLGGMLPTPDYAIAYIDTDKNTYLTPPCLNNPESRRLVKSTIKEVYKSNLQADGDCVQSEGFFQEGRSGIGYLLEKIGILSPLKSRWNPDGTWNW